jgi:hypothetical protein
MKSSRDPVGSMLGALRQGGRQFQLRRRQQISEPKFCRRSRQPGEEEGRGFGRRQTGELGAIPVEELEPAIGTAIGIDRHICRTQLVDVAIDGPDGDLELLGQGPRGHPPAGLQEHEDRQQSARAHMRNLPKFLT